MPDATASCPPTELSDARDHIRALLCIIDEDAAGSRDDPDYDEASRAYLVAEARAFLAAPEKESHCPDDCSCRDDARHALARSPGDYL